MIFKTENDAVWLVKIVSHEYKPTIQLVSQASHISLFPVGGVRGRENMSGHSGQLSWTQMNVIIACNGCSSCTWYAYEKIYLARFDCTYMYVLCGLCSHWHGQC